MQTHVFAFWAILLFVTDGCIYCTFLFFLKGLFSLACCIFHLCIVRLFLAEFLAFYALKRKALTGAECTGENVELF